jgi:hypothetical protein
LQLALGQTSSTGSFPDAAGEIAAFGPEKLVLLAAGVNARCLQSLLPNGFRKLANSMGRAWEVMPGIPA